MLTTRGIIIEKKILDKEKDIKKTINSLIYRIKLKNEPYPREFRLIHSSRTFYEIDRFRGIEIMNKYSIPYKNLIPIGKDIVVDCKIKLSDNQAIVCNYLENYVFTQERELDGTSGCILKMKAGSGKTFVATEMIKRVSKKTLIVVPNTYLLTQWTDVLTKELTCSVGCYYGVEKRDGDVVVAIINSTLSDVFKINDNELTPSDYYNDFGFAIFDECHMYCSGEFKKVFKRATTRKVLGLSATPDIKIDQSHMISIASLGQIIDADNIKGFNKSNITFKASVIKVEYSCNDDQDVNVINPLTQQVNTSAIINNFVNDPFRNALIVNKAVELFKLGKETFIFSDRRRHLEILHKIIFSLDIPVGIEEDEEVIMMGGADDKTIEKAKHTAKIILTTYQYSSTGVSINKMTGLILATPRRTNMTQIVGRILRLGSDISKERIIVDIVDMCSLLKNQFSSRKKEYKENKLELNSLEVISYKHLDDKLVKLCGEVQKNI